MSDYSNADEQKRLESYLNIHLKKDELSEQISEQIEEMHKRKRNKWIQLGVNIAAILFFGYSFYYGLTQLKQIFFIIILVVFVLNVGLIFYQKNQIDELVAYLNWKKDHPE